MVNSLTAVRVARPQQALVQMPFPPAHWLPGLPHHVCGVPRTSTLAPWFPTKPGHQGSGLPDPLP